MLTPLASLITSVIGAFITPDFSNNDPNGNLEGLKVLQELQKVTQNYYDNAPDDAKLAIWVAKQTREERWGNSFCTDICRYPHHLVTRYRVKASWGGKVWMDKEVSRSMYNHFAEMTHPDYQTQPISGPR